MTTGFVLSRVYRFATPDGVQQIASFPDDPPSGGTDIEIRMKHFTEIETFTFLAYILSHEMKGKAKGIRMVANLEVSDREMQDKVNQMKVASVTDEELGDTINDFGLNWEHFVASLNNLMIPGNPLKISDTVMQEKIDSLDLITEALVSEVNLRAREAKFK